MILAQSFEENIVDYIANESAEKFHCFEIYSEELLQQKKLNYWECHHT